MMRDRSANASLTLDRAVRRLRNMSEMMDRLGIDTDALAQAEISFTSVHRACQFCSADEVCHDWLMRTSRSLKRAPAFCPNAKRFAHAKQLQV